MSALADVLDKLLYSVVHRPYTFGLFAVYVVVATWHLGRWRVVRMTAAGYVVAWASEFSAIHTGVPYGRYEYLFEALQHDLLVLGVPFFDSLSYTFLAYFAWGSAMVLCGPPGARSGVPAETRALRRSPRVLILAAGLMTAIDVVIDPVARRGDRWFLGRIFAYQTPDGYFGVPWTNFAGWFITGLVILGAYRWIDGLGDRRPSRGERRVPGLVFFAPAAYYAVVLFGLTISFAIGEPVLGAVGILLHLPLAAWMVWRTVGHVRQPRG